MHSKITDPPQNTPFVTYVVNHLIIVRGHSQRTSAVFFEIFDPPPMSAHVHRSAPPLLWTSALGIKPPPCNAFFLNYIENRQVI